jgi:chorismate mutase
MLEEVRNEIKKVDEKIIEDIAQRMRLAEKIFDIKKRLGRDIYDEKQTKKVLNRVERYAAAKKLSSDDVKKIFEILIKMSIDKQRELNRKEKIKKK